MSFDGEDSIDPEVWHRVMSVVNDLTLLAATLQCRKAAEELNKRVEGPMQKLRLRFGFRSAYKVTVKPENATIQ